MNIRKAEERDAAALADVGRKTFIENFGHLYSRRDLEYYLEGVYAEQLQLQEIRDPETHFTVAEQEGRIVGFAKSGLNKLPIETPEIPAYELHRIYLLREAKGQGMGTALMRDALDYFQGRSAGGIYVGVWQENHVARQFYNRFGFEIVGAYRFMVGEQADDELIMQYKKA